MHRGQRRADTRKRGGLRLEPNGGIRYNCFNCKYATTWSPGFLLSAKSKDLLKWLGATQEEIAQANFEALKIKESGQYQPLEHHQQNFVYNKVDLPEDSKNINEWVAEEFNDPKFLQTLEYLASRNFNYFQWFQNFYWSPTMPDRVIIPLLYQGDIYGWTARLTRPKKVNAELKYKMNEGQSKFIFGADHLFDKLRKYVIITEGVFDAIAVDGIGVLGSKLTENQMNIIKSTDKEIIVLPDRDQAGQELIDIAIQNDWYVSFPDFGKDIKDAADAVNKFGRLMTVKMIIDSKEQNQLKLNILRRDWK